MIKNSIVWIRDDFRLQDNPALSFATNNHEFVSAIYIYDKKLVHSLFEKAKERYGDRNGGYTRIVRTVSRKGDNAQMAIIELV